MSVAGRARPMHPHFGRMHGSMVAQMLRPLEMALRQRSLLQVAQQLWAATSGSTNRTPAVCASLLSSLQQHASFNGQLHSAAGPQLPGALRSFSTASPEGSKLAATVLEVRASTCELCHACNHRWLHAWLCMHCAVSTLC